MIPRMIQLNELLMFTVCLEALGLTSREINLYSMLFSLWNYLKMEFILMFCTYNQLFYPLLQFSYRL